MPGRKRKPDHSNKQATDPIQKEDPKKEWRYKYISGYAIPLIALILTAYSIWGDRKEKVQPTPLTQTAPTMQAATFTPVPTHTQAPSLTSTPTLEIIHLPSPTLEPGVTFTAPLQDDLNKLPTIFGDYTDPNVPKIYTYYVSVHAEQSFFWKYQWCAKHQDILDENLSKMKFSFLMDETPIPESYFYAYDYDTTNHWACHIWVTTLTDWTAGDKITLSAQYMITQIISDGETTYPPGLYEHDLVITVKP